MLEYKVAYAHVNNAGDLFNEALLQYFNVKYKASNVFEANLTMLGGQLSALLPSDRLKLRLYQQALRLVNNTALPLHVWGTGFLVGSREGKLMRSNLCIHALRGALSKKKIEGLTGNDPGNITLADPGILASEFVKERPDKKYDIGIIPHFKEQDDERINFISEENKNKKIHIIDITKPYQDVLKEITECESIMSSSLHGLIFSDSLGVPNMHIKLSDRLAGDGFKFRDYYSGYGLDHFQYDVEKTKIPTQQDIFDNYRIKKSVVEQKTEAMIKAFPKF